MNLISLFQGREEGQIQNVESVSADWEEAIFVCSKCAMKINGETNGRKTRLKSELKDALRSEGIHGVKVLEVSCLDVCERNRIAIGSSVNSKMGKNILLSPPGISGKKLLPIILPDRFRS
ncbi:hypothetical protein EHQ81_06705 [Leptospira selangorensis]|uniref:(2Fe-2S) ferredoxin domain-containing protein n=1 Tax=Leptospira selangorensis TaxID=2484982 RepID=A0A4V3JDB9_9LEPT|nr:hypothetical protein [Leptospira selangorensis]TGK09339.1 hypothetical protein EHO58_02880 [Leptospira selangorensis]TGM16069.1 hypothetical protein EHQ81_06705 [Leptospira selangorensis]TGM17980.1 hypothetical protein EHQ82_13000 [Leptospira selangorensis]